MIGGLEKPKPPVLKPRPVPKTVDVFGFNATTCGRIAREPRTDYNIKLMQYGQRKEEYEDRRIKQVLDGVANEKIEAGLVKHSETQVFKRALKEKVEKKLIQYDEDIDKRRKKIDDLIAREEREYLREVIEQAQKGKEEKIKERIQKLIEIKQRNEEERLELAKEKRLQQYLLRCDEFRPAIANQRLRGTKQVQLIQIEENKIKRQYEKELENFWHDMKMKYCATIAEREEQDRLSKAQRDYEMKITTELQIKQNLGEEQKRKQEKIDDGIRLQQLQEQMAAEDRANQEKKQKSKAQLLEFNKAQIKEHQECLKRTSDAETLIQRAYEKQADEELKKERIKAIKNTAALNEEMIKYQNFLAEVKEQKEEEERNIDKKIEETKRDIERKEDDKRCKANMASQAFFEEVLQGREKQKEDRKKREEELQKAKELEIELINASRERTDKLKAEHKRQHMIKQKQYSEDLKQQMAYTKVLEEREKTNLKKIVDAAVTENKLYDSIVAKVLSGSIKISETHPFTNVVKKEKEKCPCPKPIY